MGLQVQKSAEEVKENLDANRPHTKFCFIQESQEALEVGEVEGGGNSGEGERMKATMNILNPDSGIGNLRERGSGVLHMYYQCTCTCITSLCVLPCPACEKHSITADLTTIKLVLCVFNTQPCLIVGPHPKLTCHW